MERRKARVLVATDLSPVSEPLLAAAAGLAHRLDAELITIHVFPPAEYEQIRQETRMSLDQYMDQLRARMRYEIEQVAFEHYFSHVRTPTNRSHRETAGILVHLEVIASAAIPDQILAAAKRFEADLIVMGTHARSGLRRVLLGSVAEEVLRHAPCPVMVIPIAILEARRKPATAAP